MNLLVPGLMSDMSIKGPVFWMRAGWWTDTPVQKLWGFPVWLNSVSVTGIVALSSPIRDRIKTFEKTFLQLGKKPQILITSNFHVTFNIMLFEHTQLLPLSLSLPLSPICLMPSLSSISSCTLGMSMCNRGPWGGPFTGVSKLRLFLLVQKYKTHTHKHSQLWKKCRVWICEMRFEVH